MNLRPNQISVLSIVFAAGGTACFVAANGAESWARAGWMLGAAAGIQLRLLCNMLDGMVAIEGGFRTKSGEIYNELPDRFADALLLVGAGYSSSQSLMHELGWAAAVLAVITAYVRALGASAGASQYFLGPMAKPHRMATLTIACILEMFVALSRSGFAAIRLALILIVVGSLITIGRRCARIIRELESK
jgi:phosphatidylglycerophosphate synthase